MMKRLLALAAAVFALVLLLLFSCRDGGPTYPEQWASWTIEQRLDELDRIHFERFPEPEFTTVVGAEGRVTCSYRSKQFVLRNTEIDTVPEVQTLLGDTFAVDLVEEIHAGGPLLVTLSKGDGLAAAEVATAAGVPAGPNHVVYPAMGRTFYPGGFPEFVGSDEVPVDSDAGDGFDRFVTVIDTGSIDTAFGKPQRGDTDALLDAVGTGVPEFAAGHGGFVAAVIDQQSGATRTDHVRMNPDASLRWEVDDVLGSVARQRRQSTAAVQFANLSFGVSSCGPANVAAPDPYGFAGLLEDLLADGALVVIAAGNTGDNTHAWPAILGIEEFAPAGIDHERVIVVGAGEPDQPEDYSTTEWPEVWAPGCHVGPYVKNGFRYPDGSTSEGELVNGSAYVRWCGSSFAAAAVTGRLVRAVESGWTEEQILADVQRVVDTCVGDVSCPPPLDQ